MKTAHPIIFGVFFLIAGSAYASTTVTNQAEKSLSQKTRAHEILRKRTGGMVRKAGSGQGCIVIINAQDVINESYLNIPVAFIEKRLHIHASCKKGSIAGLPSKADVIRFGGTVGVFVVNRDDFDFPMLVAPETRWAVVNVAALRTEGVDNETLSKRTTTEVGRSIGYLCGSCNSQYPQTTMSAIRSPKELDAFNGNGEVPLDHFGKIVDYMRGLGVSQFVEATYLKACKEGWAPDPQDDFQMAIWESVHQIPDKPITIEFDPKKDK